MRSAHQNAPQEASSTTASEAPSFATYPRKSWHVRNSTSRPSRSNTEIVAWDLCRVDAMKPFDHLFPLATKTREQGTLLV